MVKILKIDEDEYWELPDRLKEQSFDTVTSEGLSPEFQAMVKAARVTHFLLGDPRSDATPCMVLSKVPAFAVTPRHTHDCHFLTIVIEGSVYLPGGVMRAGDLYTIDPGEFYGPEVAGPEGVTRAELFSSLTGPAYGHYEDFDGTHFFRHFLEGDRMPRKWAGMEHLAALRAAVRAAAEQLETPA
jgi:hypothetical protein